MISQESKSFMDLTNFQSVRKRKRSVDVKLEHMDYTLGCDFIASAIAIMDSTIHNLINNISLLHQDQVELENFLKPSLHQGEEAFKNISTRIGNKPSYLTSNFDSPSLWTTLGLLSSEVVNITNQFYFEMSKIQKKAKQMVSEEVQASNDLQFESIHSRLNNLRTTILSLVETVKELVEESEVNNNVKQAQHRSSIRNTSSYRSVAEQIESEVDESSLLSSSDSSEESLSSSVRDGQFNKRVRKSRTISPTTGLSRNRSSLSQPKESDI